MLFQLEDILGDAYSDDIAARISEETDKHYVPKNDYEQLKIENVKLAESGKAEADKNLKEVIAKQEQDIINLKQEIETNKKITAVKEKLKEYGAADPDYIIYKNGGIDSFSFDDDGVPSGIDKLCEQYKKSKNGALLFDCGDSGYSPAAGDTVGINPFAKETFNLTEQGKLFKENPAAAKRLAAAAKIKF